MPIASQKKKVVKKKVAPKKITPKKEEELKGGFYAHCGEKASEYGRLGGIKSGEVRRKNREMKNVLMQILNADIPDHLISILEKQYGKDTVKELNILQAMFMAQVNKAIVEADTGAFKELMDRSSGKPQQTIDHEVSAGVTIHIDSESSKL
tara:strand:- start:3660 stop:4112 length:453 start_codon:yes stop_codon:yes gene_type:complete